VIGVGNPERGDDGAGREVARRLRGRLPAGLLHTSTHSWGVYDAIELARRLGRLPAQLVVLAIGGAAFAPRHSLSQAARRGAAEAERRVLIELAAVT
jgi:hydrogenase maturation protease